MGKVFKELVLDINTLPLEKFKQKALEELKKIDN